MSNAPERSLEPPEPRYILCPECGGEVYEPCKLIIWNGKHMCADCVIEDLERFKRDPDTLAAMIGARAVIL